MRLWRLWRRDAHFRLRGRRTSNPTGCALGYPGCGGVRRHARMYRSTRGCSEPCGYGCGRLCNLQGRPGRGSDLPEGKERPYNWLETG